MVTPAQRVLGTKQCISGNSYTYYPPGWRQVAASPTSPASADETAVSTTGAALVQDTVSENYLATIAAEDTYQGVYRNALIVQIPAGQTNYEVDIGFPARVLRVDSPNPVTIRLGSAGGDQIFVDYQTSPWELGPLPAGLAVSTLYVTNPLTYPIYLNLFAMG